MPNGFRFNIPFVTKSGNQISPKLRIIENLFITIKLVICNEIDLKFNESKT